MNEQISSNQINSAGHLTIGGVDTLELAQRYGTPLIVYDVAKIKSQIHHFQKVFRDNHVKSAVVYATKAFESLAMFQLANKEHCHFDVVSGGEIYAALAAGVPGKMMIFHGNNKSRAELEMAVRHHLGAIMLDNFHEIDLLNSVLDQMNSKINVMIRLTPGITAETNSYDQTGQVDSKFGFDVQSGQGEDALKQVLHSPRMNLIGIHCHIGSQIFDVTGFEIAAKKMVKFAADWKRKYNFVPKIIDVGGGFGIRYVKSDHPIAPEDFVDAIVKTIKSQAAKQHLPMPAIWIEPGRSIVGPAGYNLYTIGSSKRVPGIKPYVDVDGGMGDNIRPALYHAKYEAVLANDPNAKPVQNVRIAGKYCESGDIMIQNQPLPKIKPGDILAVLDTGAYGYSMAMDYNMNPRPAVVFVENGKSKLVIRRETYADMIRLNQKL
ncbi:diaminopimelate decarboxylase [Acetilactobacillus jinshanensis]|uniref:Diaminopimelate decarboxylase n=1 Tax=Acetilactobacillus jinshanensis TaxID=1720083 RepID=A0A4P6ZKF7_9LACO|nr:diaminopimelate decarboxylase [Acetilactobacillus jinshanensis]QBP18164.1 diaminopimelate decarboxylase [Acetilactobacillus jinshanensis]URL61031.1 diaminopimelate decarboxylase [uncultured bacterium]